MKQSYNVLCFSESSECSSFRAREESLFLLQFFLGLTKLLDNFKQQWRKVGKCNDVNKKHTDHFAFSQFLSKRCFAISTSNNFYHFQLKQYTSKTSRFFRSRCWHDDTYDKYRGTRVVNPFRSTGCTTKKARACKHFPWLLSANIWSSVQVESRPYERWCQGQPRWSQGRYVN